MSSNRSKSSSNYVIHSSVALVFFFNLDFANFFLILNNVGALLSIYLSQRRYQALVAVPFVYYFVLYPLMIGKANFPAAVLVSIDNINSSNDYLFKSLIQICSFSPACVTFNMVESLGTSSGLHLASNSWKPRRLARARNLSSQ